MLVIGVVDQTSRFFVPDYARDAGQYHSDGEFAASIERVLPAGASIFQLPYVPFPEGYQPFASPGQTIPFAYPLGFEYEEARPYLQSTGLRWSYGAMKGRAADWPAQLAAQPVTAAVAGAAAAGFDGIEVDLSGYPGTLGDRLRQQLHSVLGVAPLISHAGDLLFYDLRAYAARLRASHPAASVTALRSAVLDPLRLTCATGRLTIVNPGTDGAHGDARGDRDGDAADGDAHRPRVRGGGGARRSPPHPRGPASARPCAWLRAPPPSPPPRTIRARTR